MLCYERDATAFIIFLCIDEKKCPKIKFYIIILIYDRLAVV